MRALILLLLAIYASLATATISFSFTNETYPKGILKSINDAMNAAVSRYNIDAQQIPSQHIELSYDPAVTYNVPQRNTSTIAFGTNPYYQKEWAALNAISHVIGIGQTNTWYTRCNGSPETTWPNTAKLVHDFDGYNHYLLCDSGQFMPYGLNNEDEFDDTAAFRHCKMVQSFVEEGLQNP